ncbi:hypothetical protein [Pseudogemmobacter humi]|uniref:DUF4189 domain-containing protein n=1 Tax=Pseudogemmobacter humi TaxID=2483812 RepID=A0A3P5WT41_9RHOB|nr:hypothetical protein [Pseudogemmobacter humi]VDC22471.1 hypothetical protein XINFAN_00794 [Pseudogemmobacter humi]
MKYAFVLAFMMVSAEMAYARPSDMGEDCNAAYDEYLEAPAPKAFAKAKNDACGYQYSSSLADAKKRAVAYCVAHGGQECRVVESKKK